MRKEPKQLAAIDRLEQSLSLTIVHDPVKARNRKAHIRMIRRTGQAGELFIGNAIDAYNFRRQRGYAAEGYPSFDAYLSSPHTVAVQVGSDNGRPVFEEMTVTHSGSSIHLGVQVVFGLCYLFLIKRKELEQIGEKKLRRLIPWMQKQIFPRAVVEYEELLPPRFRGEDDLPRSVHHLVPLRVHDPESWLVLREIVMLWIRHAQTLSESDLGLLIGKSNGWEIPFSQPIPVGTLRRFQSVDDLLEYFGVGDLPDEQKVMISFKYKRGMTIHARSRQR